MAKARFQHRIYIIGSRYPHHASHSGYEGFSRYLSVRKINCFRFTTSDWGWKIDKVIAKIARRPFYALGAFLTEVLATLHMLIPGKSLFHVLYSDTDLWLLGWSSRITRNPIIATFHDPPSNLKWLQIDERIVDNLAAVVLVSESQRPHFKTLLPPDHIFFVPHGIDTEFFIPGEKLSSEQICITVGSHERDFATLTKAIDIVHKEKPHVRFIAVGAHRESPFEHERVEFLDHVGDKELLKLYQTAMVAVFSFYGATANNALLEAMACGLPVVSTDVGGVREYLGDDAGILCPPHDPDALAAAMLELLNNPLAAEKMGKASRARALKYDYQIVSNKMGQIYYKILKEG